MTDITPETSSTPASGQELDLDQLEQIVGGTNGMRRAAGAYLQDKGTTDPLGFPAAIVKFDIP